MNRYNLEAKYFGNQDSFKPDEATLNVLWTLFCQICKFWKTSDSPERMKSDFVVFVSNRIEIDSNYAIEYKNYLTVIEDLITEHGNEVAFKKLFTDPQANITPPITNLARAKQYVVNEFISLNLALGSFKTFGDPSVANGIPINYPGFIGGMNKKDKPPYRTNTDKYAK